MPQILLNPPDTDLTMLPKGTAVQAGRVQWPMQ